MEPKKLVRALLLLCLIFVSVVAWQFLIWYTTAYKNFGRYIKPGETYRVAGRTYTLPNLKAHGRPFVLKEEFVLKQRTLMTRVLQMLSASGVEAWLSGGSLLGFTQYGTFIPWDDDIDMHTHWSNRDLLFGDAYVRIAEQHNLEMLFLMHSNMHAAHKDGSAVRFRCVGDVTPVCDLFFVQETNGGARVAKVDSWRGDRITTSRREDWRRGWIFPLSERGIDGFRFLLPADPEAVLKQQYGPGVTSVMKVRHPLCSHEYFYRVFSPLWLVKHEKRKKPRPKTGHP